MTDPLDQLGARSRRGAHRARPEPLRVAGAVLAGALVVGGLGYGASRLAGDGRVTTALGPAAEPGDLPVADAGAPDAEAADGAAADSDRDGSQRDGSQRDGEDSAGEEFADPAGEAAVRRGDLPVVVLNQSGISGLAADVAADLGSRGWPVGGTGNFRGTVTATTVYYPSGGKAAAAALAADLPGPDRTRPVFGNLSRDALTVVVTSDFR